MNANQTDYNNQTYATYDPEKGYSVPGMEQQAEKKEEEEKKTSKKNAKITADTDFELTGEQKEILLQKADRFQKRSFKTAKWILIALAIMLGIGAVDGLGNKHEEPVVEPYEIEVDNGLGVEVELPSGEFSGKEPFESDGAYAGPVTLRYLKDVPEYYNYIDEHEWQGTVATAELVDWGYYKEDRDVLVVGAILANPSTDFIASDVELELNFLNEAGEVIGSEMTWACEMGPGDVVPISRYVYEDFVPEVASVEARVVTKYFVGKGQEYSNYTSLEDIDLFDVAYNEDGDGIIGYATNNTDHTAYFAVTGIYRYEGEIVGATGLAYLSVEPGITSQFAAPDNFEGDYDEVIVGVATW